MKFIITILLLWSTIPSQGQQKFSVKLNQKTIGSATILQVADSSGVTTHISSRMSLATLEDTTQVSSDIIYSEDTTGTLRAVQSNFSDTKKNTFSKRFVNEDLQVLGPYAIQTLSRQTLKKTGDTVSFLNYNPDLNKTVKTYRSITSKAFVGGRIVWTVIDSTGLLPNSVLIFSKNFELKASKIKTAIGEISTKIFIPSDSIISLYDGQLQYTPIPANIILPEPNSINALTIRLEYQDAIQTVYLADTISNPLPTDSIELAWSKSANQWIKSDDLDLFLLADSLTIHVDSDREIASHLVKHCAAQDYSFPVIQLITMARSIFIPSRFVQGYHYQNGLWVYKNWCELGIDGEWILFDPYLTTKPNPACYLPIERSYLVEGFSNMVVKPKPINITILQYL